MSLEYSSRSQAEDLRKLDAQFDAQLAEYTRTSGGRKPANPGKKSFSFPRWSARMLGLILLVLFPFFLLIRISLFTYISYNLNGWVALSAGIAGTILILVLYGSFLAYRINGKARTRKFFLQSAAVVVCCYCCYALLYLSSVNVKSAQDLAHYRSLHPILRVTMATAILADGDLIITDMQRTPEDYRKMGLPAREKSLHYRQSTGYVHAVDLRTQGRPEWKNQLSEHLLRLLGYHTLRHVGTADHLHVSLPLND